MDLIPQETSKVDLLEELHSRSYRAGLTTRSGGPISPKVTLSVPWGRQKLNVWPRDKRGRLVE